MQQGMLFHTLAAPETGVYFEQLTCVIDGPVEPDLFLSAWRQLATRHAILRTAFVWEGLDEPLQAVHKRVQLPASLHDWRELSEVESRERFQAYLQADRANGFALGKAPLFRLALIRETADRHRFVCAFHHLLLDGWSLSLALQEVFAHYAALQEGKEPTLSSPRPYRGYLEWLASQDPSAAEAYWRKELAGFGAPTTLGLERTSPEGPPVHAEGQATLSPSLTTALLDFAHAHKLTLNSVVQGLWAVLLSRYSDSDDVLFGATVSGRPPELPGADGMIGLFINTLPIRILAPRDAPLVPWLQALQRKAAELRQYEHSSLVQIQGYSELPRGVALFDHILVFENYPVDASLREPGTLAVSELRVLEHTNYAITVVAKPGRQFSIAVSYDRQRVETAAVERLLGHFTALLESALANPGSKLGELEMLCAAEKELLLRELNATESSYSRDRTVVDLFEAQVARTPDAPAVAFENSCLRYAELGARSQELGRRLRALGVGPESLVAILLDRSIPMVVAELAVLRAGGAYVPLDPSHPPKRLAGLLSDCGAQVLVTRQGLFSSLESEAIACPQVICLDRDEALMAGEAVDAPPLRPAPDHLAYVIYTSGSTGAPKGVEVEHRALMRLIAWHRAAYGIGGNTRTSQLAGPAFDAAAWELWPALASGACVDIAPDDVRPSAELLAAWLARRKINLAFAPTALAQDLLDASFAPSLALRTLLTGGDKLRRGAPPGLPFGVVNHYGPTECTVVATCAQVPAASEGLTPTIGRPIDNTQAFVLSRNLEPVPSGVPGELWLGGDGLARGYLGRPRLTAERFLPNPFGSTPGSRLYRTGDRVRLLEGGELEFLGRLDHQVKVRGFRVELEEVESALARHADVRSSAVIAREGPDGEQQLVAYVASERNLSASELRAFLRERLPEPMVPSAFVFLASLPLTPNGKVDRRALPAPDSSPVQGDGPRVAPRNRTELILWSLWQQVLGTSAFGVTDRFADVGGHSLGIIRLVAHIEDALGVRLSMRTVMENPTIELLAAALHRSPPNSPPSVAVPLQTSGSAAPLFLVHPAGGTVACYFDLARCLGAKRPVFGLQAIGIDDEREPIASLESMAQAYVRAVREAQPKGPYLLAGWSAGGQIAFEMANQLAAAGERVGFLGLIDADAALYERLGERRAEQDEKLVLSRYGSEKLGVSLPEALGGLPVEEQLEKALALAREAGRLPPGAFSSEQALRALRVYRAVRAAVTRAPPRRYSGDVTFIRAASPMPGQVSGDPAGGWRRFVEGTLRVLETPGDHESLMREPHCRALAERLGACLADL